MIVPGSGPTDRDGDSPLGLKAAPYRLLAEALAAEGIASARIDKRGTFASMPAVRDGNDVTIADYASDVHSWIRSLRAKTGVRCVWVLGHSEGALVAEVAAEDADGICGIILVAGMGRKLADVLRAQLQANPANAPLMAQALPAIAKLEAGQRV
ncbi:MAG TPA: alpha/beta fold hydrolase, partial [Caulobacteraceae bacterium]|nr:alpha/beta fold hydrolase [Caulobacteraceae bacterium]